MVQALPEPPSGPHMKKELLNIGLRGSAEASKSVLEHKLKVYIDCGVEPPSILAASASISRFMADIDAYPISVESWGQAPGCARTHSCWCMATTANDKSPIGSLRLTLLVDKFAMVGLLLLFRKEGAVLCSARCPSTFVVEEESFVVS